MTSQWASPQRREGELSDADLLRKIAEVRRRAEELPADDFATRFGLEKQLDELRSRLHDATAAQLGEAQAEWAERAGRKGEHAEDVEGNKARARMMPGEGGHV